MSLPARLVAWMVALSIAMPLAGSAPAAADTSTVATSSLRDLVRAELPDGAPGLLGAVATQDFHGTPVEDQFLGAAVLEDDALGDTWAHGGELGAWLAPEHASPAATFRPELNLNESLLFESIYDGGPPVGPGDRAGFSLGVVPYNAPLTWERERGDATGRLEWSATSLAQQTSSTFAGVRGGLESFMFRADVVATGGDVDARTESVQLPPLVLDLPRSYETGTRYVGITGVVTPYTTYFADFSSVVLPELGKMIVRAEIEGYIPEGRTVTLPNGSTINEWHLPLTGVIGFATSEEGEPSASIALPPGGVAQDLVSNKTVPLEPGATLLATSAGASASEDEPATSQAASPLLGDAREAARLDRRSTESLELEMNNGFSVTVHPDHDGTGLLALEGVRSDRLRKNYADLVTVPAVRVAGQDVMLTRDKLLGLRAIPFRNGGGIRFTPSASFTDGGLNQSATTSTRIYRGGFLLDARYALEDGIVVNVQHQLFHEGTPNGGRLNTSVTALALDGRPIEVYPLTAGLLSGGSVSAGDAPVTTEASLPSTRTLEVGAQRINAAFRIGTGALRAGTTTVLRQPAPLLGRDPDPSVEITGVPLALAIAPPDATGASRKTLATIRFGLVKGGDPDPAPPELGDACHGVQIRDHALPDAPPSHDIKAAWFEADAVNVYVSMQVADVPSGASALPVRYSTYFWSEHEQYLVEALQQNDGWVFQTGFGGASFRIPIEGDVMPGPDGVVRAHLPRYVFGLSIGDWVRDAATHSFAVGNRPVDSAPQGSSVAFGRGDDYRVEPCIPLPPVLDTAIELDPIEPAQYSDTWTVSGRLHDESGEPLASQAIDVAVDGDDGKMLERSTETGDDGTFSIAAPASMRPGDYEIRATFTGEDDAFNPSSATATLTILKEDSALTMAIEGKGASRAIVATLSDADDSTPIAERELAFYADGVFLGNGVTDQQGRVTFELPPRYRGGHHDYETAFEGDDYYLDALAHAST